MAYDEADAGLGEKKRPVVAIVATVVFFLFLWGSLLSVVGMAMAAITGTTAPEHTLIGYRVPSAAALVWSVAACVTYAYCGLGLLRMRKLAWKVSLAMLFLEIAVTLAKLTNLRAVLGSDLEGISEEDAARGLLGAGIHAVAVAAAYAVLLVLLFRKKSAFGASAGETTEQPDGPDAGTPGIRDE